MTRKQSCLLLSRWNACTVDSLFEARRTMGNAQSGSQGSLAGASCESIIATVRHNLAVPPFRSSIRSPSWSRCGQTYNFAQKSGSITTDKQLGPFMGQKRMPTYMDTLLIVCASRNHWSRQCWVSLLYCCYTPFVNAQCQHTRAVYAKLIFAFERGP
jgi:hypothetical protein